MHLQPNKVIVIEDSARGLRAAKSAGMNCLVTKSSYTANEDFANAVSTHLYWIFILA